jgi:hypothetical protein
MWADGLQRNLKLTFAGGLRLGCGAGEQQGDVVPRAGGQAGEHVIAQVVRRTGGTGGMSRLATPGALLRWHPLAVDQSAQGRAPPVDAMRC